MIQRNVSMEAPGGVLYNISFSSEPESMFIRIIVRDLNEDRAIMSGTVRWRRFETLKFYGYSKTKHFSALLGAIERELKALLTDQERFSSVVSTEKTLLKKHF